MTRMMGRILMLLACAATLTGVTGCAVGRAVRDYYANDRCWVEPERYAMARDMFIETGSLDLVRHYLEDLQWRRCEINETVYRLQKEFEVVSDQPRA